MCAFKLSSIHTQARKQVKDSHGKRSQGAEDAATTSSAEPQLDELGLEPPPSNLPAPWAKTGPQLRNDDTAQAPIPEPAEANGASSSSQPEAKPRNNDAKIFNLGESDHAAEPTQLHRGAEFQPESEVEMAEQRMVPPDNTLDYILGSDLPAVSATSHTSPSEQSPEQTERSSGLASDRSLMQAKHLLYMNELERRQIYSLAAIFWSCKI